LDLIPAFIQPHGHGANKRLDSRGALVVRRAEAPAHLFVVQNCYLEGEVLLQVLDDHHQERQLDAKRLCRIRWADDVGGAHICPHDLEDAGLNVGVCQALNVPISDLLVPDLQRFAADRIQDGQEARLVGVFEHDASLPDQNRASGLVAVVLHDVGRFVEPS